MYNKTKEFLTIKNELSNIISKLTLMGIPFIYMAAVENNEETTKYMTDGILTGTLGIDLTEDRFAEVIKAMHGAKYSFDLSADDKTRKEYINAVLDVSAEAEEELANAEEELDSADYPDFADPEV